MNTAEPRFAAMRHFIVGLYFGLLFLFLAVWLSGCRDCSLNYYSGVYATIPFLGGFLGLLRVGKARPIPGSPDRLIILLFSAGLISFAFGLVVWVCYNIYLGDDIPYPSWADVFFVPYQLCWAAGIFILYWSFGTDILQEISHLSTLLLGVWGATAAIMFAARGGTLNIDSPTDELLKFILDLTYPVIDSLNVAMLIALLTNRNVRQSNRRLLRIPLLIILLGIVLNFASDLLFNATTSLEKTHPWYYMNGGPVDLMYATSTCILGIGILMLPLGVVYKSRITQKLEPPWIQHSAA